MNYGAMFRAGRQPISTPGMPDEDDAADGRNAQIAVRLGLCFLLRQPWALPARSHSCCFADIFGTWDFAVWLTGNQLQTCDQMRRAWPARALLLVPSRYAVARGGPKPHSRLRPEPRWANVGVSHAR
jgi:hypothetical protein